MKYLPPVILALALLGSLAKQESDGNWNVENAQSGLCETDQECEDREQALRWLMEVEK